MGVDSPRLRVAVRNQLELRTFDLDSTLPADHAARSVWDVVEQLDLIAYYDVIAARGETPGRPATDPKILVALWIYATTEGVGSARQLARLCETHDAYRWLAGGVSINHHTLSDFRIGHEAALDGLLTQVVAVLMHRKLVKLRRVAQDGMRVRAHAGAASFRRGKTLEMCRADARAQLTALRKELDTDPSASSDREKAARERAARERLNAVNAALDELRTMKPKSDRHERRTARNRRRKERREARVSTTDPQSRVMKMPDGGFRPAYNVQLATDADSPVIVGVRVVNQGTDHNEMIPMLDEIQRKHGKLPQEYLVDGGYAKKEAIAHAAQQGVVVYAPVPKPRKSDIDPFKRKRGDPAEIAAWRRRMGSQKGQTIYKLRGATAEPTNADLRCWRGLDRFNVRGLAKVNNVARWSVLAHNVRFWMSVTVQA